MKELPQRKNTRLKEFDYSQFGYYFITICVKNRREFFSNILSAKIILTDYGKIVDEVWNNLPKYYNIKLDYYVIMPDHFHGIIILDKTYTSENKAGNNSLSKVIGKFKSFTTRKIRERLNQKVEFEWQKSFYDRIIRNEKALYNIRNYIQNNPLNWVFEKNNPENLEM